MRTRAEIAGVGASRAEVDNQFWEPGDEWVDGATGIHVDVMFRSPGWIEDQLDRVLRLHAASVGYSTAFWHNILTSRVLYDRHGWFGNLQSRAHQPYPERLRRAIVAKNHPILRRNLSAYTLQLRRAVEHADAVSVNHRVAALLASYFDILFAVNRLPHPGEKRLVEIALQRCDLLPEGMARQVEALIAASARADRQVLDRVEELVDSLDRLLEAEGLIS